MVSSDDNSYKTIQNIARLQDYEKLQKVAIGSTILKSSNRKELEDKWKFITFKISNMKFLNIQYLMRENKDPIS